MTAGDGAGLTQGKESRERSNGTGDGNEGLEVGHDVIEITSTLLSDSYPKDESQDPLELGPSPSSISTLGEQTAAPNTITSDNVGTNATSIPTANPPSKLYILLPPNSNPAHSTAPMSSAIAIRNPAPTLSMTALAELSLHSPSSQIVGTPFASSSTPERFEYPFPDTPSPSGSPPLGPTMTLSKAAASQPSIVSISPMMSLATGSNSALANASIIPPRGVSSVAPSSSSTSFASSYGNATRAAMLPHSTSTPSAVSQSHAQVEAPPSGPLYGNYSTHTPTHPKLRAQASAADPPVPPSLARKRRGWNLGMGLLGRRRSATAPTDGVERSPLESPRSEYGK